MNGWSAVEHKAVRLVVSGNVRVEDVTFDGDGLVLTATGFVTGDSGNSWLVEITPEATRCNCPNGVARRDAAGHSHDLALRLAAQGRWEKK